ncbi:uncharacterized protein JCM6883_002629 [Sporobolomyces salmoneus]|uniref:uncharacterized protein n=1 Tax=Sporobolomyces salmoneus TaxID=183962 RepID=UPI00317BC109
MPIPFVPTEIVEDIVFHLRATSDYSLSESISSGKALSLFCQWSAPIGQALRWRFVKVDPSSMRSLSRHFQQFPHLAKLVRTLIYTPAEEKGNGNVEEAAARRRFRTESLDELLLVLQSTSELWRFDYNGVFEGSWVSGTALGTIIQAASALQRLKRFKLQIADRVDWTAEATRAFDVGFFDLEDLSIWLNLNPLLEPGFNSHPSSFSPKKVETFRACIGGDVADASSLGTYLLQQLDPSVLRECYLARSLARNVNYELLSTCSRLNHLTIVPWSGNGSDSFFALVQNLQRLSSLHRIAIHVMGPLFLTGPTNIPLNQVLAACPPSLRTFSLTKISFDDYASIPVRPLPKSRRPGPVRFTALRPGGSRQYVPLIVWKDGTDEGDGEKWYRTEVEHEV